MDEMCFKDVNVEQNKLKSAFRKLKNIKRNISVSTVVQNIVKAGYIELVMLHESETGQLAN